MVEPIAIDTDDATRAPSPGLNHSTTGLLLMPSMIVSSSCRRYPVCCYHAKFGQNTLTCQEPCYYKEKYHQDDKNNPLPPGSLLGTDSSSEIQYMVFLNSVIYAFPRSLLQENSPSTSNQLNAASCTTPDTYGSEHVPVQQAMPGGQMQDISKWSYSELQAPINQPTVHDVQLVEACRQELGRRLKAYEQWKANRMCQVILDEPRSSITADLKACLKRLKLPTRQ